MDITLWKAGTLQAYLKKQNKEYQTQIKDMGIVAAVLRNEKLFALKPKRSFRLVRQRLGGAIQIRAIFVIAAKERIKQ